MRKLYPIIVISFLVLIGGCSTVQKWEPFDVDEPYPWVTNEVRAKAFTKSTPCLLCPTGREVSLKWVDQNGRNLGHPADIEYDAKVFLAKTELAMTWPKSWKSTYEYGAHSIAPYLFYVVAVNPTVILMVYEKNRDYVANVDSGNSSVPNRIVSNRFELTTILPKGPPTLWFSHDLKSPPKSLGVSESGALIVPVNDESLVITKKGTEWHVLWE